LRVRKFNGDIAIPVESFAQAVGFAISQPKDVDVNESPVPAHAASAVS
jgi:NADP-dependent 3-hydroxy acid dehydrogenase YdfG